MAKPRYITAFSKDLLGKTSEPLHSASEHKGHLVALSEENLHHLKNVLRLSAGDKIEVIDTESKGIFLCELVSVDSEKAVAKILDSLERCELHRISLIVGLTKPKVSDFITEKCVELGVSSIHFFQAERSQSYFKNEADIHRRLDRLKRITTSALKQSGFHTIPEIYIHTGLKEALQCSHQLPSPAGTEEETRRSWRLLLVPAPGGTPEKTSRTVIPTILDRDRCLSNEEPAVNDCDISNLTRDPSLPPLSKTMLEKIGQPAETYIIIGPEGGFTEAELTLAQADGYLPTTLGPKILRTETAAIVACALAELLRSAH